MYFFKSKIYNYLNLNENKLSLAIYFLISVLEAIIYATLPLLSAKIILNITDGILEKIIFTALFILGIETLLYFCNYMKGIYYEKIYQKTIIHLQSTLSKQILKIKQSEIDKHSTGIFFERLNKDTAEIATVAMDYIYYTSSTISNVGILIAVFSLNKILFLFSLLIAILSFVINTKRLDCQYKTFKKLKKLREEKTSLTSEVIKGIKEIKTLNATNNVLNIIKQNILSTSKKEIEIMNIKRNYIFLDNFFKSASDFLFVILACYLCYTNSLSIPTFIILYNYQPKLKKLFNGIVEIVEYNKRFKVSANRILELANTSLFKVEEGIKEDVILSGNIIFNNVNFAYTTKNNILENISLEIKENEKVAFIGKSGCGKSTLFNLVNKIYTPSSGEIYIDGYNIADISCKALRKNICFISQSPYFFNFSIRENLSLAKEDATLEDMYKACDLASIANYITTLPEKYNTTIGENGSQLSGGQKQRLAIARGLLQNAKIILLDEATSALDSENQQKIDATINSLRKDHTILIITHKLSTIQDCDRIFVLDNGKIIASGTHEFLLQNCPTYTDLWEKNKKK